MRSRGGTQVRTGDAALVERYVAGDRSAFDDIYRRYRDQVYRLMTRMTHSHDDADEMTQETFVHVLAGLPRFQRRSDLFTWIYRIAKNLCLRYLDRNRRRREYESEFGTNLVSADPGAPDALVERNEEVSTIAGALARLPAAHRRIMHLGPIQGHDYDELARMLGTSRDAIKSRLHRARAALRHEMSGGRKAA